MKQSMNKAYQQNTMWNQQIQQIAPLTTSQISSLQSATYNLNSPGNGNYPAMASININDILFSWR